MNDIDKMNSRVNGALYYLMTEIFKYSPDKGGNELTKRAYSYISLALTELSEIKQRAEEKRNDGNTLLREIELIDYILEGEGK